MTIDELKGFLASIAPAAVAGNLELSMLRGAVFVHTIPGLARFRCDLYSHLGNPSLCLRVIPLAARSLEELNLPPAIRDIALGRRGLVLITGEAGSGRTTTMNVMVDIINDASICKIITIEDPVEFVHAGKKSLVSHRSVGSDTPSFEQGLTQALGQDADVIVLGKLPDVPTVRLMLRAAEGGRQVIAVVDSPTTIQAIERIMDMLPAAEHKAAMLRIATNLDAIIALRLATTKDGRRRPAVEILRGGPITSRSLLEGRLNDIATFMTGRQNGMQTFDQHLAQLHQAGVISGTEAMRLATSPEAVMMELRSSRASASA